MTPKVSLIVVTYLEKNQRYLDLCLRSIENLDYPKDSFETIVVSSGAYVPKIPDCAKQVHNINDMHYPEAINFGAENTSLDSKHLLLLNDDTLLTKDSLKNLVHQVGDAECIVGPTSNCDNHFKYHLALGYRKPDSNNLIQLDKRFYRYDDWAPIADELMNAESIYPSGFISQEFVCFYATLIPRKVWDKIGPLDRNFKTGQDDLDYCLRAKENKIPVVIALHALIWHFGGTTADEVLTNSIRNENIEYYKKKWGFYPAI